MSMTVNPLNAFMGNMGAKTTRSIHVIRFPEKDLRAHATNMYSKTGAMLKFKEEFKDGLKKRVKKELVEGQEGELKVINDIEEELKKAIIDIIGIGQLLKEAIIEVIQEDEKLRKQLPEITREQKKAFFQEAKLKKILNDAGDALKNVA